MLLTHENMKMVNGFLPWPFNTACHFSNEKKIKDVSVDPWDGKIDQSSQLFLILINNGYFKVISMRAGHSGTVHLSSNGW